MGRTARPTVWKQILLLGLAFTVVGSGTAYVLYSNAVSTVSEAAQSRLLDTSHLAALQIDVEKHTALADEGDVDSEEYRSLITSLFRIVGTVNEVERLYTVRQSTDGQYIVLNASRTARSTATEQTYFSPIKDLPADAGAAWKEGVTFVEEKPIKTNGETVYRAFVPLILEDRSVESLLVVELNYSSVEKSLGKLKQGLWIALGGVVVFSLLFAYALTKLSTPTRLRFSNGISFHKNRRIWITITLLLASTAILFDGAVGFFNLENAGAETKRASQALQASQDLQKELTIDRSKGWSARLDSLSAHYDEFGQPWLANQIGDYRNAVAEDAPNAGMLRLKLIQAAQQDVARIQGDLGEASGRIQTENSLQSVRLGMTVVLGLVALVLMSAVSRQEKRLEAALDENTEVQQEYENLIGNLPIGLFAYANGNVLFTNGAWGNKGDYPKDVLDAIHKDDRAAFDRALAQAELDRAPFSATIRIADQYETTHFEAYCAPVTHADGQLRHILVFCVDVTPLVAAKEEVHRKHGEVEDKNRQLSAVVKQVEQSLHTAVETMIRAVEVKDPYTAGHSERVRQYSVWMGEHLSLSAYEIRILSHGARIHDVGKIGIPDAILTKPTGLTESEFEIIKQHTVAGAKIVGNIEMFKDCVPIVRWHHERLDGSGYPDGLVGDEIPFLVKLVAVADMFDAMTSNRSYREGMQTEAALSIIASDVLNGKIDTMVFDALKSVIGKHGVVPQIDSGDEGRVA